MADILSVGIDIGTSTTQLVFSRISMKNMVGFFSVPRVEIVDKEVLYKSPVHITPLMSATEINSDAVRDIVAGEYREAGFSPGDVDTGAVIITGESARKENAAAVLERLSDFAGDFVVSTAGPDLESVIAGKGSGAWQYSKENHVVTANLDIGGGTTNIVIFDDGKVIGRGCYDIGGRLIRLHAGDSGYVIDSISPAAALAAREAGVSISPGAQISLHELRAIAKVMEALLAEAMGVLPRTALLDAVRTPESDDLILPDKTISRLFFSGGVADYIYRGEEARRQDPIPFGDIGVLLAAAVADGALSQKFTVAKSTETIRATVVGAGTYTTSISGSTISYAETLFPIKNIPALKLTEGEQQLCFEGRSGYLEEKLRWFLGQSAAGNLILALPGKKDPSYVELKALAAYVAAEADRALPPDVPLLIVLEQDMAKALGILIKNELQDRRKLACIDGIHVEDNDYVDMGRPLLNGLVIPVVVKTLLFG